MTFLNHMKCIYQCLDNYSGMLDANIIFLNKRKKIRRLVQPPLNDM